MGYTLQLGGAAADIEGVQSNLWVPPESPNALDMEFNTSVVDPGWSVQALDGATPGSISAAEIDAYDTAFNSGTAVRINQNPTTRPSWMMIQAPAIIGVGRFSIYRTITLPTNLLIMARIKFNTRRADNNAEDSYAGISLHKANTGVPEFANSIHLFLNEGDAGETLAEYRYYNPSGTGLGLYEATDTDSQGQALEYVAIHKIGTTYYGWVGTASGNWIYMARLTASEVPYVPDLLSIKVSNTTASTIGPSIVGVDFIRFYETDKFLF